MCTAPRHKAAVEQVRAVLYAHARGDTSAAGELLEALELTVDASPLPISDALTVASRFAQLAQSVAPELPAAVIAKVGDSARLPDAPDGMAGLCDAVLLDCDAASGIRTVIGEHGLASALYAAAAMTSAVFSLWSRQSGRQHAPAGHIEAVARAGERGVRSVDPRMVEFAPTPDHSVQSSRRMNHSRPREMGSRHQPQPPATNARAAAMTSRC